MAGEASQKRKGKLSRQESSRSCKDSELDDKPIAGGSLQNKTRSGIRVYKIVVLGDGGVGKSGNIFLSIKYLPLMNNNFSCNSSVCKSQFSGLP